VGIAYDRAVLRVLGPSGEVFSREFSAGETIVFDLRDRDRAVLPDGEYSYRLEVYPAVDPSVRAALETARKSGNQNALEDLWARIPSPVVYGGSFQMRGGVVSEPPPATGPSKPSPTAGASPTTIEPKAFNATDWFVQNTLGVGTDVPADDIELKKPSFPFMRITETNGTTNAGIHLTNPTTGSNGPIMFVNPAGDFRITTNVPPSLPGFFYQRTTGRIGLQTLDPYQPVTVDGTVGWKDGTSAMLMLAQNCCSNGNRMILAHSPLFPNWGIFYNDTDDIMRWQQSGTADTMFAIAMGTRRVGVNTPTPAADFHIVNVGNSSPQLRMQADGALTNHFPNIRFTNVGTAVGQLIADVATGRFVFDYESSIGGNFSIRKKLNSDLDIVFFINPSGQAAFNGTTVQPGAQVTVNGNLHVNGNITKTGAGEVVVMRDGDRTIQYSVSIGPEIGTYVRGTARLANGEAVIELPDHFAAVTAEEGLTVQLTLLDECNGLRVVEKSPQRIVVKELAGGTSDARFDYLVQGLRKGYENLPVVEPR
jgi:hypothetical protein